MSKDNSEFEKLEEERKALGVEVQRLVNKYLEHHPGEDGARLLSDKLYVSIPTIKRWSQGKNLPCTAVAKSLIKNWSELVRC